MTRYGQYCPLALAAETLGERWNILILQRLIDGCRRFSQIHAGVPKMSATLLSRRLADLEAAGLLLREPLPRQRGYTYRITAAGEELAPLLDGLAVWGQRWARDMTHDDLDPAFLMYSLHKRLNTDAMPAGRIVIEFAFSGISRHREFWLIRDADTIDMCLKDPGIEPDVLVRADIRRFIEGWRGFRDLAADIRSGTIQVVGPRRLVRQFPDWLMLSGYAGVERLRAGRERAIARR